MMLAWRMKITTGPGPDSSTPSTSNVRPMIVAQPRHVAGHPAHAQ